MEYKAILVESNQVEEGTWEVDDDDISGERHHDIEYRNLEGVEVPVRELLSCLHLVEWLCWESLPLEISELWAPPRPQ